MVRAREALAGTADRLPGELLDSDSWGDAERLHTALGPGVTGSAIGVPMDPDHTSLEMESSFLMRAGREPTNDEILEYLERHRLQVFLTEVIMHVARHFPPDPFEFLLDHIEAMVVKYKASHGKGTAPDPKLGSKLVAPVPATPVAVDPKRRAAVVRHVTAVLQHDGISEASASKLFAQFAGPGERMREEDFGKLAGHLQQTWGLDAEDGRLMSEVLKRWRFRANAARGTRGLPLWPLSAEDFVSAYPSLLRSVRDRYVPIGSRVHRSLFIRQAAGKLTDSYAVGAKLGQGAYGEVSLVTLKSTQERRVCKRVGKQQSKVVGEELMGEVELMRAMDHPHIIRIYEYFETEACVEMILEPVFGGTLTQLVTGLYFGPSGDPLGCRPEVLTESWLARALSQLLSALAYAHGVAGVVHKDLKCDNVLLVGRPKATPVELVNGPVHVMLADFGIAEVFAPSPIPAAAGIAGSSEDLDASGSMTSVTQKAAGSITRRSTRVGGTPSYMSPEMFRGSFTEKSDLWSLGVMVFQLMTGQLPYKADNLLMQARAVCNPRRHPPWDLLSEYKWTLGARWFCQQLLSKDEGMRPSAEDAMRDTWLTKASATASQQAVPPTDSERRALQMQHLESHLLRMATNCITSQLNLSQLHHLNLRFQQYDTSGDGRLSHVEMRQVLADVGIKSAEDAELIIEALDGDRSGLIEYSEFVSGCLDLGSEGIKDHLRVAFAIFDLDGSGAITMDELRQVLTQGPNADLLPLRPTSPPAGRQADKGAVGLAGTILPDGKTVEEVMQDLDLDGKGMVEYGEFESYIIGEHLRCGQAKHVSQGGQGPA